VTIDSEPPVGFFERDVTSDVALKYTNGAGHDEDLATSIPVLDCRAIAEPLPDLEYIVREIGLVAGGGAPHLLAGYGFSGKTVAVQSLCLSLAAGQPIWGVYKDPARRVCHIDFEQGERLTRRRYQRLAAAMGISLPALGDALVLAVMPPITLSAEHVDRWRQLMTGRDLIIVDSLRAASGAQDENDSRIRVGLDMLGTLSEHTKCRALVIHHARKMGPDDPGGRYAIRGSSAIYDSADSAYVFTGNKGEPVAVEHVKARTHGEPVPDWALLISDEPTDDGDNRGGLQVKVFGTELIAKRREESASVARSKRTQMDSQTVRKAIEGKPGMGTRELRSATGLSGDRLFNAVSHLGESVDVREESQGRIRLHRHYIRGSSAV
jgi:hypothetical protein